MPDDYESRLDVYEAIVGSQPGIERKGKKMPYTSMNGNMFSFLDPNGTICVRLPMTDVAAFQAEHGTEPVVQYGAVMKEYVAVPEAVTTDATAREALFARSVACAQTLKPKPTKR